MWTVNPKPEIGVGWWRGKTFRRLAQRSIATGLILIGAFIIMIPLLWMARTSVMPGGEIFIQPMRLMPSRFLWENYPRAIQAVPYLLFARNSAVITFLNIVGIVLSSSLVAYAFARLSAPGKGVWFALLLITMMLPDAVRLVPTYLLFRTFGWLDTYKPLIVPHYFGSAFYVFMLRQFYMTLPRELDDAAKIDGCSFFGIFWRLILPLSKPAVATVAIFSFYSSWNDFMEPMIYLNTMEKYTFPLGLTFFVNVRGRTEWNLLMAASIMPIIPCVVLFFLSQRYFVQGISLTGIKG